MCTYVSLKEVIPLKSLLGNTIAISEYQQGAFFSAYDHPNLPILTMAEPHLVQVAEWGLIPQWLQSEHRVADLRRKAITAQAEKMFTNYITRSHAVENRCLIFINGFYKAVGRERTPYFFYFPEKVMFAVGGIYADAQIADTRQSAKRTCTLLTTSNRAGRVPILKAKSRVPLILPKEYWDLWLNPLATTDDILNIAETYEYANLEAHSIASLYPMDDNRNDEQFQRAWTSY